MNNETMKLCSLKRRRQVKNILLTYCNVKGSCFVMFRNVIKHNAH